MPTSRGDRITDHHRLFSDLVLDSAVSLTLPDIYDADERFLGRAFVGVGYVAESERGGRRNRHLKEGKGSAAKIK